MICSPLITRPVSNFGYQNSLPNIPRTMNKVCSEGRPPLGKQRKGSGFFGPKGLIKRFPVWHSRLDKSVRKCGVFFSSLGFIQGSEGRLALW